MNLNGINGVEKSYETYESKAKEKVNTEVKAESKSDVAAVYEQSADAKAAASVKIHDPELVERLKADLEARTNQIKELVAKLISQQAETYGKANDIWSFLREGNFTVDPETKAQAQADIAEDGYWGVNQTSDRIVDFAIALAGDDKEKLSKMMDAFKQGYAQAEKTWGGELPEISKKTFDATIEKFEKLINGQE